jgi:CBS domain-containing protein
MANGADPVQPSDEVRKELREYLEADSTRIGEMYRLTEEGLDSDAIAERLGKGAGGQWKYARMVRALLDGDLPTAPTIARQAADRYRTVLKMPGLSAATRAYLQTNLDELNRRAGDDPAYLLDGKRVTIDDLLKAELLAPGDMLRFKRPRIGRTHYAAVTPSGTLTLEGGQEFNSPSRAAAVAADMTAVDGWHAWVLDKSGQRLDALRQELLDETAEATETSASPDNSQRRYEWLKEARGKADAGDPVEISVRELLGQWDAESRDSPVNQRIEADLANHGLASSPNFRKVTIDATVRLITAEQEAEISVSRLSTFEHDAFEVGMGLTVGNLPSALSGVAAVQPTDALVVAITRMRLNGYSQLAVLAGRRTLRGAVTWESIANARNGNPDATLADAIVRPADARYDQELIEILPLLEASGFVFVRNQNNEVAGIVTTADVVGLYRELATPFLLIGELDQVLRQLITHVFTLEDVRRLCDRGGVRSIQSFDDLDMGDYQRVLENPDCWQQLGWPLDRASFIERLSELREIRNDVMHFNPDPLPPLTVEKLRKILKVIRDYGSPGTNR